MVFPWKKAHKEKIFINYRRDDAGGFAGRLSDMLADYFGRDRVFRDDTDIDYGHDFEPVIDQKRSESGAVVVLIGVTWTSVTDTRRLVSVECAYFADGRIVAADRMTDPESDECRGTHSHDL